MVWQLRLAWKARAETITLMKQLVVVGDLLALKHLYRIAAFTGLLPITGLLLACLDDGLGAIGVGRMQGVGAFYCSLFASNVASRATRVTGLGLGGL